jgi:hypothetical protein
MGKKIPISKLKSIEDRFLDLRFSGLEDAISLMGSKDKKQYVWGGTGFRLKKNRPLTYEKIQGTNEEFQDAYNNYEENATYTGKAYLRMTRKYRGKEYNYLVTVEDIPKDLKDF